ncbi:Phytochrome-like protein cph1 [Zhongshania aliphaticivorans]|uniref:histidine kinase n=1 Tax=Zhongshania aliphaticivorans TaxID=1470434 RepID=A0A5S9PYU8_9GAMM|nr:ATP-binding protein [Zhongshania aliphaticivorans]CAA0109898.1 Phytochrome-like protein cph1 [Zhongshania aliphaticivorans]CAA0117944.1 Phytochrome-like protein cph1 [Zhongshania aliphaticivorans]CAA0121738.1 Phytochrome-like protein cph1 [Zhongshania aliphaticivorans]
MSDVMNFLLGPEMPPHGHCYLWNDDLVRLHVISDVLITLSYFTIPIALVYLVRKREDLKFNYIFVMFAIFIFACGATHLINIFNVWYGAYWLSGFVKLITAIASVGTAIVVWPLIPKALAIPSNQQLLDLNQKLRDEAAENTKQRAEIERLSNDLQRRVDARTEELAETRVMKTLLEQNQLTLERSNAALEQYAMVTARDIKEPLRSIAVFGELLSDRLMDRMAEDEAKWLGMMVASAKRTTSMIDDLHEYSLLKAKGDNDSSSLDAALERALEDNADSVESLGVRLQRSPLGVSRLPLEVASKLMSQILSNAIKFSAVNNTPEIVIGPLADGDPGEVGFYIRDNGIGIARQYRNRIFGVFERLQAEHEYEGNGIGLAICRRILDEYDGRIMVEGSEGEGAEFRVYLPAA